MNCGVNQLLQGDRATGVILDSGEIIRSNQIISTCGI